MKHKVKKLMAYIYMPLIFTVIGYGILYIAAAPVFELLYNIGSMIMVQEIPDFQTNLENIYSVPVVSVNQQSDTIPVSDVQWPLFGQQYGELTCERIELSSPVYFGDNNDILRVGTGQYIGSFIPGYGRVILLCAHNTTFFKPLQYVKVGDVFTFKTSYGVYQYKVTETRIADHQDSSAYDLLKEEEQLILYTCYPFETLAGTKTDRLFVYADKIAGPTVVN